MITIIDRLPGPALSEEERWKRAAHPVRDDGPDPVPPVVQLREIHTLPGLTRFWEQVASRTLWEQSGRAQHPEIEIGIELLGSLHAMRWCRMLSRMVWATNQTLRVLAGRGWRVVWNPTLFLEQWSVVRTNLDGERRWPEDVALGFLRRARMHLLQLRESEQSVDRGLIWTAIPVPGPTRKVPGLLHSVPTLRRLVFRGGLRIASGRAGLLWGFTESEFRGVTGMGPVRVRVGKLADLEGKMLFAQGTDPAQWIRGRSHDTKVWQSRDRQVRIWRKELDARVESLLVEGPPVVPWQDLVWGESGERLKEAAGRPAGSGRRPVPCEDRVGVRAGCRCPLCIERRSAYNKKYHRRKTDTSWI